MNDKIILDTLKLSNTNYDSVYAEGGNKEKAFLPMIFTIHGDYTIHKDIEIGKIVRLKFDGFEDEIKVLEMTNKVMTIETSREIGKKLIATGNISI